MMPPRLIALVLAICVAAGVTGYKVHRARQIPPALTDARLEASERIPVMLDAAAAMQSFADLDGAPRRLDDWAGTIRVVNFWATWCPPCMREIPAFMTLQERYGESGVQFIGIAMDKPENVSAYAAEQGVNYPLLVGQEDVIALMQSLGNDIGALPYTAVIARDGSISAIHQGEWSERDAETALKGAL